MSDSVDVLQFKPVRETAEEALQTWLDENPDITSLDEVSKVFESSGRVGLAVFYSA